MPESFFVLSKDNLENRLDGACARYLNLYKTKRNMPYALFVHGNSSLNIKNGSAMLNEKAKEITKAIFGHGTKDVEQLGKGVERQYGKGEEGFNISSCQFQYPDGTRRLLRLQHPGCGYAQPDHHERTGLSGHL